MDPSAGYGVIELGSGAGRWNPVTARVDIPTVQAPFPWGADLDLGDAMMAAGDGVYEFVWGCALESSNDGRICELARLDTNDRVELWSKAGTWVTSTVATDGMALFGSGPWISSVVATAAGVEHVFVRLVWAR